MKQVNGMYINDYEKKAFRPLTFAERKVNLSLIEKRMNSLSKVIDEKVLPLLIQMNLKKAKSTVVSIVSKLQKEAFELGKQTAGAEMKVLVPKTIKEVYGVMKKNNHDIITKLQKDIAIKRAGGISEKLIQSQYGSNMKTVFLTGGLNLGREVVYEDHPEKVYGFQYSAILDGNTTDLCRRLDGMIVKKDSAEYKKYQPPLHWNCRSIRVEILMDEVYKPKFTPKRTVSKNDEKIHTSFEKDIQKIGNK